MLEEFAGNTRFSIVRRLGAGGMGIVYEAEDRERHTRVALKTLRNVDPAGIYRFKVEFRSLAELSHENLLPLYELFFEDGHWFFTMELLEGATDLVTFVSGTRHQRQISGANASADAPDSGSPQPASPSQSSRLSPEPDNNLTSNQTSEITSLLTPNLNSEATSLLTSNRTSDFTALVVPSPAIRSAAERFEAEATALLTVSLDPSTQPNERVPDAENSTSAVHPQPDSALHGTAKHVRDYAPLRRAFLAVAQGVRALHAAGKLHRDLKPENVMVRADGRPVLLDFGLVLDLKLRVPASVEEQRKQPHYKASSDHTISGTFAYMAPEQATGSPLLESSDWYAFGVMLFEALTGRLPISGKGVELLRAKVAQDPPPPSKFVPSTPPELDRLCVQLLSRDPAKRPSGAEVLRCLCGESSAVDEAVTGRQFFIGRESYLASLNASFQALQQGASEVLCVRGCSGVGKTALLQHFLAETVTAQGGILLEGRCYEQESVPYKAVDNLVDALTELLLEMPAERLHKILPENIQSLARVFPVLKRVTSIGSADAAGLGNNPLLVRQQAFEALGMLLSSIGASDPLVLHVDDLQWGDIDSAQLLASILAQPTPPRMLVLLSYRSEYSDNPCLREFRRAWESGRIPHRELEVLPLTPEESRKLATELLAGTPAPESQIERIVEQARGSAFFVQELARSACGGTEWQSENAGPAAEPGDLDKVLWRRVQQLPEEARQLIEIVAVAGQPIRIGDLAHTRSFATIPQHALKLLRSARLVRSTGARLTDEIETFHDRVRESVTKFLAEPVRSDYHLQIADALELNQDAAPETIASHLQSAQSPRASHFYELAGERAIRVLAFDRAEEYLKLAARFAPTPEDRVRVEIGLIHFYTDTARFQDAYNIGIEAASPFGVKLPRTFVPPQLIANMIRGLIRKGRRKPLQLLDLPVMTDQRLIAVVGVIAAVAKAAYQVRPEICVTICTMGVNLSLKNGNSPDSAIVYMVFGCIFLGGIIGRAKTGYEFGLLALALIDKFQNEKQRAEVNFVVGYFGTSWMRPAIEAERLWQVAFNEGQRTGDLFHTGCAAAGTVQGMIMRGAPLDEIEQRIEQFWPILERAHLREPLTCLSSTRQCLSRLRGADDRLNGNTLSDDPQLLADLATFGSRHFAHFHFLNQCMLHALTASVSAGLDAAARSAAYLPDSRGLLNTPEHFFWSAMLHAMNPEDTHKAIRETAAARKKFGAWNKNCPANFALRHELLCAEESLLRRKTDRAMQHYQRAIELGQSQRTLHLLAFANQRAAQLATRLGRTHAARQFTDAAQSAYAEWGAFALTPIPAQSIPEPSHQPHS